MTAYYSEWDPFAAEWMRNLIDRGLIPAGDVDTRSIKDVQPDDIRHYTQVHLFAGLGGWPLALRLAGWPDDRRIWSGSAPCQPFSSAGKQQGQADERHLWPEMFRLVRECRPPIVFGEQVSNPTVVGPSSGANKNLSEVQGREALFGVLCELQGEQAMGLQGLRTRGGADAKTKKSRPNHPALQQLAGQEAWPCTCERSETSGENTGHGLRLGPGRHTPTDHGGLLRVDRHPIRPEHAASMERPLARPDRLQEGLSHGQRASGAICPECHGEYLGSGQDYGDCVGDFSEAPYSVERLIRENWPEAARTTERVWLDGVFDDLEGAGYTCGAAVLGAFTVGAPHKRSRLYWVADAELDGGAGRFAVEPGQGNGAAEERPPVEPRRCGHALPVVNPILPRLEGHAGHGDDGDQPGRVGTDEAGPVAEAGAVDAVEYANLTGPLAGRSASEAARHGGAIDAAGGADAVEHPAGDGRDARRAEPDGRGTACGCGAGAWSDFAVIHCLDGKARRVGRGVFPLAPGIPRELGRGQPELFRLARRARANRTGRLKGYGNAITVQVAAEFIAAWLEARP